MTNSIGIENSTGHPLDTFRSERVALLEVVAWMRHETERIERLEDGADPERRLALWRAAFAQLTDVEKRMDRTEHLVLPRLESRGPGKLCRSVGARHDEVRRGLEAMRRAFAAGGATTAGPWKRVVRDVAMPLLAAVERMLAHETTEFLPSARELISADEWETIRTESPAYGWCLVVPPDSNETSSAPPLTRTSRGPAPVFPTGALTFEELRGVFDVLPIELTFIDVDDRVRYFSDGAEPLFDRGMVVLGRKVQGCHPAESVAVVDRLLGDLRSGRHDVAQFWLRFKGRFAHVRYFAVRDPSGKYLGALEMVQDLDPLRALEGERRILSYDITSEA